MRRQIPTVGAMEAFEAVVRFGGVTAAARELGRTQSAISRQLLSLEAFLRRDLFKREQGRVSLNEAGKFYFEIVTDLLDTLEKATAQTMVFGAAQQRILLCSPPTFGARLLIPRLSAFQSEKSGIELTLTTGVGPVFDFDAMGIDAAVQYGSGEWPGLTSYELFKEEVIAVTSPEAVAERGTDLISHELLRGLTRPKGWETWIEVRAGAHAQMRYGLRLENFHMLIEAACMGYGVALVPVQYVERELASGRLCAPFGDRLQSGNAYYLCFRQEDAEKPAFILLRDWLQSEQYQLSRVG